MFEGTTMTVHVARERKEKWMAWLSTSVVPRRGRSITTLSGPRGADPGHPGGLPAFRVRVGGLTDRSRETRRQRLQDVLPAGADLPLAYDVLHHPAAARAWLRRRFDAVHAGSGGLSRDDAEGVCRRVSDDSGLGGHFTQQELFGDDFDVAAAQGDVSFDTFEPYLFEGLRKGLEKLQQLVSPQRTWSGTLRRAASASGGRERMERASSRASNKSGSPPARPAAVPSASPTPASRPRGPSASAERGPSRGPSVSSARGSADPGSPPPRKAGSLLLRSPVSAPLGAPSPLARRQGSVRSPVEEALRRAQSIASIPRTSSLQNRPAHRLAEEQKRAVERQRSGSGRE